MADRRRNQSDSHGPEVALLIGMGIAALLVVHWLATLSALVLAGLAAGVVAALFASWAVFPSKKLPRNRVRHMRLRARLRLHPSKGHATAFELWLRWGRLAAARRARRSRPSLSLLQRLSCPEQTSVLAARAHYNHALRVPVEEHIIYIAPPRAGKTGTLADVIAHHPGAVVATTTRGDLHALTAQIRAARGPVYVFNPQQLADVPSTMRWDMLAECEEPATAIRRAQPLAGIAAFKGEGEEFWASASMLWLQTLLHVAALREGTMDLVHYWALQRAPEDFLEALPGAGGEAERWGALLRDQMTSAASRTTDSIRYMIAANLGFMVDPVLREAVTPGPGMFSPAEFVTGLRDALAAFGGRADEIERRLKDVGAVLERMSGQIGALAGPPGEADGDAPGYQVNPVPPWWKPDDDRCQEAAARLADWVAEVYRPVFGYLAGLLAPCWQQHPLCLAYLDVLHEAWCLLYLAERDPKMVFAQLDWLTRSLLQAAEVMANDTRPCRDRGHHREPGQEATASPVPRLTNARR